MFHKKKLKGSNAKSIIYSSEKKRMYIVVFKIYFIILTTKVIWQQNLTFTDFRLCSLVYPISGFDYDSPEGLYG